MNYEQHKEELLKDVGYRRLPDIGPEGVWIVGHGTRLDQGLSQEEATALFHLRVDAVWKELIAKKPTLLDCPVTVQGVMHNIAHDLSVPEILRRKRPWTLIKLRQFDKLANEILRMAIAQSQPVRTQRLADKVRVSSVRIKSRWQNLLPSVKKNYKVTLEEMPHMIQISVARILDVMDVEPILEREALWRALQHRAFFRVSEELAMLPGLQFKEPVSALIAQHIRKRIDENYHDVGYIEWLSRESIQPAQHLTHGKPVPIY